MDGNTENHAPRSGYTKPTDKVSLISWRIPGEIKNRSGDREMLIALIGAGGTILAIIAETYIFALLLLVASAAFICIMRKARREMLFDITTVGIFLDDDFLPAEKILAYNIIDDPGERARLLVHMEKFIHLNEIIPIYDVHMAEIERAMGKLNIERNEELKPTVIDTVVQNI